MKGIKKTGMKKPSPMGKVKGSVGLSGKVKGPSLRHSLRANLRVKK